MYFRQDLKKKKSIKAVKPPYKDFCPLEYPDQLWNTRDDGSLDVAHVNDEPSLTQQQFAEECDINNIMKNYQETGTISHMNPRPLIYEDFSRITDYQGSLDMIREAGAAFQQLPAKVRSRFENDPGKLVEFCRDPNNYEEAITLGLAEKKAVINDTPSEALGKTSVPQKQKKQPDKTVVADED